MSGLSFVLIVARMFVRFQIPVTSILTFVRQIAVEVANVLSATIDGIIAISLIYFLYHRQSGQEKFVLLLVQDAKILTKLCFTQERRCCSLDYGLRHQLWCHHDVNSFPLY